jgi:uncharacterized protein YoaH (UPF0181 family)
MSESTDEPDTQRQSASLLVSVFSGGGIGLMVGALLGLAMSPTVAAFVGAIGTALAALLGLNDKHFSASKGLRIGAFGLFALLGAATGIYTRSYGVFAPSLLEKKQSIMAAGYSECQALDLLAGLSLRMSPPENDTDLEGRKKDLLSAGFSNCQALSLLARQSSSVAKNTDGQPESIINATYRGRGGSGLMASAAEFSACDTLRGITHSPTLTLNDMRSAFKDAGTGWGSFYDSVNAANLANNDKLEVLFIGRDAICNADERPSKPQCDDIIASMESGSGLQDAFGKVELLVPVRNDVNEKIRSDDRETTLGLLAQALCGRS